MEELVNILNNERTREKARQPEKKRLTLLENTPPYIGLVQR
jgi:hypothetical protein